MKKLIYLIDIDGTITNEDIPNEKSHLYGETTPFIDSVDIINELYDNDHIITFFTAREEKDREITVIWLNKMGYKYHGLIMNKPRCMSEECEYVWIDNKPIRGITFKGTWSKIEEVKINHSRINTLLDFSKPSGG